ncbi:type VI secretion system tip protein VgrG [Paraburkholderia sp. CNPSo 3157]|uniref:Type VI secretion system tip protein VgrG n=1 Tax=Paraburkholderia franconis TaxID=2654983 RepID=A0A7X1N8Z7_9BURK|nr:type VI secretion system tip protein VgrG [Paraburkholderia franconis]
MFKPLQARTLSVECEALPLWGGEPVLLPSRLKGTEALGKPYRYELDMVSVDSPILRAAVVREKIDTAKLAGRIIDIRVEFEGKGEFIPGMPGDTGMGNIGAGTRTITGIITEAQITGTDDRHMYYRFVVRPWLWLASRTVENRIFQNASVVEITEEILKSEPYHFPVEWRLGAVGFRKGYPPRDYVRQFWQTDLEFLEQIWREWGIYYFFEGSTLVLCDSPGSHKTHDNAYDNIIYHVPDGARIDEEHIHRLKASRRITSGTVKLADYDSTRPRAQFHDEYSLHSGAPYDDAEHYQWGDFSQPLAGAMGLSGEPNDYREEARHLASVRVDAMRCKRERLHGRGNLRALTTGKTFHLERHPQNEVNGEYLVVSTTIDIRNVDTVTQPSGSESAYQCVTDFVLQPANTFFKNKPRKKPRAHAETAVVTGYDKEPIWPDAFARAKVWFVWDRRNRPDQNSSCWVRVSSPWQGNGYGFIAFPRTGDEVTIGYHEGDPDKPFVSGRMVNQFNQPPWDLPANDALTGILSQSLKGREHNQVVTDDTPGKLQVQVTSDHDQSRLVLGYNTRIVPGAGRQDPRGEGFELATEGHGVARSNRGMLLTTESRSGAQSPMKDMGETVARLTTAHDLHDDLAKAAQQNEAQQVGADQSDVTKAIGRQNDAIEGTASGDNPFPEMNRPDMVLSSAAGVAMTARQGVHVAAHDDFAVTTGRNIALAAAKSLYASVRDVMSLCVMRGPMKLVSVMDRISIVARNSLIELRAKEKVSIGSLDTVEVLASKKLVWNAGGTQVVIDGSGFTVYTDGKVTFHSADVKQENPLAVPEGLAPLASHPVELSCSALAVDAAGESPTVHATGSQSGDASARAQDTPAPAPAPGQTSTSSAEGQDQTDEPSLVKLTRDLVKTATQISHPAPGSVPSNAGGSAASTSSKKGEPATGPHTCTYKMKDIDLKNKNMSMESADYWGVYQNGTAWIDPRTNKQIFLSYVASSGTFDLAFDVATMTITATVIVLVIPKRVRLRNAVTKELKNNADGTPASVPYETFEDNKNETDTNRVNQNSYKLTPAKCQQGDACSCQISVKLRINFVTSATERHHAQVNLYAEAERADSGNWGEKSVRKNKGTDTFISITTDKVQAHETGHLFSFPDEYYDQGGAVHKDYITMEQKVDIKLGQNNPNKDTWQGTTSNNLMGTGVYSSGNTPSYYVYRISKWFGEATQRDWKVDPHKEA